VSAQNPAQRAAQVKALTAANEKLRLEVAQLRAQLAESRAQQDKLQAINAQLQQRLAQVDQARAQVDAGAEATQMTAKMLQQQVASLQKELSIAASERDKNLKSVVELTDQLQRAFAEVSQLKAENVRLRALAPKEDRQVGGEPEPPKAQPPDAPPNLFGGEVLSIAEDGRVEISFGSDDGLTPGHRLEVYRPSGELGIYVGQIEVVQTQPQKAVCKPVLERDKIRKGDRITSKL
jgi:hypothetical protein